MNGEASTEERGKGAKGKSRALVAIIVAVLLIAAAIALRSCFSGRTPDVDVAPGEVTAVDDFYHAEDGTWKMETTIHLLKEQKYVSSDVELGHFLIYTASPGEMVRISQAAGRWKFLEVMSDGHVKISGWADAEDHRAELQADESSVQPDATMHRPARRPLLSSP